MAVLVIDIGGSRVKCLVSGEAVARSFRSGSKLTPDRLLEGIREHTRGWNWDRVAIGIPAPVRANRPVREPENLGPGWVEFDYDAAFRKPVRIINDAAMQALGSYQGGRMLFVGLGTGMGSALVLDGLLHPLELAHLPYTSRHTYEQTIGERARRRIGMHKWRVTVRRVLDQLYAAFLVDYIVVGGGNVHRLAQLPEYAVRGSNANAFRGGFMLWKDVEGEPAA